MKDYIKVPAWMALDNINSNVLKLFVKDVKYLDDKKINMDSLREFYKVNKNVFIDAIDELSLRGFEFFSVNPNNMLPKMTYSCNEEYIYTFNNEDKYLEINFNRLGLGNFLSRFQVKEDIFFNYIPIKGFKTLNPNIEIDIIKKEFLKSGFFIKGDKNSTIDKNKKEYNDKYIKEEYVNNQNIDTYFYENKYNLFRNFCHKKGIKTINDITYKHVEDFSMVRGVGKVRIKNVIDRISEISLLFQKNKKDLDQNKFIIKDSFYNYIRDFDIIKLLAVFGKSYNGKNFLVSEVQGNYISEFANGNDVLAINECLDFINFLSTPNEIAALVTEKLTDRERFIINSRYLNEMTLEEIGNIEGISRERVRQLEKKTIKKIIKEFKALNLSMSLRLILLDRNYIFRKDINKLICEEFSYLINICINKNLNGIKYFEPLEILYFKNYQNDLYKFKETIRNLPEIFLLEDYIDIIENSVDQHLNISLELEEIDKVLIYYGYENYGNYYSTETLYLINILEIILKDYIKRPIKLDNNNYKKIKVMCKEIFNIELNGSIRSVEARIRDIEDVVLVDNRTFCHIDNLSYEESIINHIESYLDSYFKNHSIINVEKLFSENKELCKKYNVKNKMVLYSLVKYYFDDKYVIGSGNTLNIYKDENSSKYGREDRVILYLKNNKGKSSKKNILSKFKWKAYKLEDVISKSDNIIGWDSDEVILLETLKLNDNIINKMEVLLGKLMKKGFTTSSLVFDEMLFDDELHDFLKTNQIDNSRKLGSLIRKIFNKVDGHTKFFYLEESKYKNIYDVIKGELNYITSRQEIKEFIVSYGYKGASVSMIIDNLIKGGDYLELSQYDLILSSEFHVLEKDINSVAIEIERRMNGKEYISLSNLRGYRNELPDIGYKWNPYLIKTVLEDKGFRSVKKRNGDYRYDKVIMVKEDSNIVTFEDLVYHILKYEYNGNLHEVKIYDYLASIGVLRGQEDLMNKKLPYEIQKSEKILIDPMRRIKLI